MGPFDSQPKLVIPNRSLRQFADNLGNSQGLWAYFLSRISVFHFVLGFQLQTYDRS